MAHSFRVSTANQLATVHECPDCGLFSQMPAGHPGTDLRCGRCNKILRRVRREGLQAPIAWAISALLFYLLALTTPYINAWLYDSFSVGTLLSGPAYLERRGYWELGAAVLLFTVVMPLIKVVGLLAVMLEIQREHPRRWAATLFGWLKHLTTWSMIEVYLLGFIVAYTRLQALLQVRIDVATFALVGLMITMAGLDATMDPEAIWEIMRAKKVVRLSGGAAAGEFIGCDTCHEVCKAREGEACPRCGSRLHLRVPNSGGRSWALTITAALLYIPSNLFPVMTVMKFGKYQSFTIFAGLKEFVHVGMWPLALLVFTASIAIPLFKLVSIAFMLTVTRFWPKRYLRLRTRLYRVIDFIGRWSMVDIFMVSILVALVHFGEFARITAEPGAIYFTGVVVLTMLAVESFDPRLMWDASRAEGGAPKRSLEVLA